MDLLYWSRHFRNMPGEGDLPVVDFMRAVAATGYDGPSSLEIFNDQFRGGSPKSISVDGRRSLINLMDQVRRAEPALQIKVPEMPDRIAVEGVEFVEFAANEQEVADLGRALASIGFSATAKHRTKDVTLWRQGPAGSGINLVVNTEHEGFAHSSYLIHGTNAYAIGLLVSDAAATVARARALGAETFEQKRGPGELPIPAIRGVGGGVIYFIDSALAKVWDVEFEPVARTLVADAGLARIDHVAQTMNYEEMLTWILFYTSIFRAAKAPMVDVVDPAGLVRSQAIEGEGGALRLTLYGAENRKTLAGHFIAESFGSSVRISPSPPATSSPPPLGSTSSVSRGLRSRPTIMTISKPASALIRTSRNGSRPPISSTTATRLAASISSSTAPRLAKASSLRSSSGAAVMPATALPTPRFA
jgi:4-hydroxyphenylpyruvate dioxygenase